MAQSNGSENGDRRLLLLTEADNVAVATVALEGGERVEVAGRTIEIPAPVPLYHKIAVRAIAAGEKVIKYGVPMGSATRAIAPGEHVHLHNLTSDYLPTFTRSGEESYLERR